MKILKIGAVWCVNCIVMRSVWEEVEREFPQIETEFIDIDDETSELARKYDVKDIPVTIFLDAAGEEKEVLKGTRNKEEMVKKIKEIFNI